jgi:hypothetical protein
MVQIRVRPRELKQWRAAAKRADETLSEWIRTHMNLVSTPVPPPVPPVVSGEQAELPFVEGKKKRAS